MPKGASVEICGLCLCGSIHLISQSVGIACITPVLPVEFLYLEVIHA